MFMFITLNRNIYILNPFVFYFDKTIFWFELAWSGHILLDLITKRYRYILLPSSTNGCIRLRLCIACDPYTAQRRCTKLLN